ncbi:hypothetical protein LEP1GSC047_4276 [Leptospira inadai serovar Lyme str. 10]|uniref:Lipoprotein n=2 Tax=Leptospira inadai serovar Lyme TaxID=293084 RepID=V6HCR8_9LEPT|nr:hypothetical protein [Leptospira inadai]EQA37751.1 hypothetical protein LEP1GSC047_4276 [Leptospira inadai serovar Lyme str. 10]PNV73287.1 hypothetical protein BES34_017475 [Leptospira inadai serovar Lyme]
MKLSLVTTLIRLTGIGLALLFLSECATFPNQYDGAYGQSTNNCSGNVRYSCNRSYYPYRYGNYYGNQTMNSYNQGSRSSGHNPFFVPGSRYHNLGRPSHWRL